MENLIIQNNFSESVDLVLFNGNCLDIIREIPDKTVKVELAERLILPLTDEEDWTLDPFMGSGTTQIASIIHNRKSIGAEISKEYYDIVLERIRLAEEGKLKIRPKERPVYDPAKKDYIPPKII